MNEQTAKPAFKGEILLCEDNSMNQEIACERLAKLGLKTITANNGKEGLEIAEHRVQNGIKPFDLIFMDIFMPVMGGLEAADKIAKLNTGTPIVAMTANNAQDEKEQYAAHGMSDCLNKPFTPQELFSCLTKYIKTEYDSIAEEEEKIKNKLTVNFVRNNKNIYNEITGAIENGDIKLAHRLAHTLKGSAGFFGKTLLQNAAKDVENLLVNEENRTNPAAMNALKTELDAVLKEFEPLALAAAVEDFTPENKGREPAAGLFEELETLLDGGDVDCLNFIDRLRAISEADEPMVRTLIQQIEYFEFDAAKKTLLRLKEGG